MTEMTRHRLSTGIEIDAQDTGPRDAPPSARDSPSVQGAISSIGRPARSQIVGSTSMVLTGWSTRLGAMSGAAIISGTRAEPSKKFILNHSPRSPSISPWSDRNRMIVSCWRVASSTSRIWPILSST